jgi:hypothetical protein
MDLSEGLQRIESAEFPLSHRELSRLLDGTISHASVSRIAKGLGLERRSKEECIAVWKQFMMTSPGSYRPGPRRSRLRIELSHEEWKAMTELAHERGLQTFMLVYQLVANFLRENKKLF